MLGFHVPPSMTIVDCIGEWSRSSYDPSASGRQRRGGRGALPAVLSPLQASAGQRGDGRYRGGPGCELELVLETEGPAVGDTAGDGVKYPACGMKGGHDGLPHRYILRSHGRRARELKTKEAGIEFRPGDVIHVRSGGGGGWGDPGNAAPMRGGGTSATGSSRK